MKLYLKSGLAVLLSLIFLLPSAKTQEMIPDDFCINDKELLLYNLINNFRKEHGLAAIPLSKSLSYVARLHVNDLHHNRPDTANCNLHSWSDKGVWAECCYGRDQFNNTCMTSKPRELTSYNGKGYEIAFWENLDAIPEIVLDLWINSAASREMIINADIWLDKPWKALGIGMHKGYAVAWFGDEDDQEKGVKICDSVQASKQLLERVLPVRETPENVRYYLIIASFKERSLAEKEVAQLRTRGFRSPSVVVSGENYRVSLGTYDTREEALKAKGTLSERYQKAWLLKQ
jgi:hypothetical protein